MKILHIATYDTGGAANAAIRLHKGLLAQGVDSRFLSLYKNNTEIPQSHSVKPVVANSFEKLLNRVGLPRYAYQKFWHKIRKDPYNYELISSPWTDYADLADHPLVRDSDIINLHFVANFVDYPSFFKKVGKPIVWTMHDMAPIQGVFHYEDDKTKNPGRLAALDARCEQVKINSVAAADELMVVCPSRWLRSESARSPVFAGRKTLHIPYGLPTDIFHPLEKPAENEHTSGDASVKKVLFVSENIQNYRKGLDILIQSMDLIQRKDIAFLAIGENRLADTQFTGRITFMGRINSEREMAKAYAAADCFVLPSREDNLPNTMLESLSCGTPVVGFDIGGVPDAVQQGSNGVVVKEISPVGLARGIEDALNGSFDRASIASQAAQEYALQLQAKRYIGLYEQMV